MAISSEAKWSFGGVALGLLLTLGINFGAEAFREGTLEQRVMTLENADIEDKKINSDVRTLAQKVENLSNTNNDVSKYLSRLYKVEAETDSLRAYSISHNKRLDSVESNQANLLSDQKVTNVLLKDLTKIASELSSNTKELTSVVKDVAVLELRIQNLEKEGKSSE